MVLRGEKAAQYAAWRFSRTRRCVGVRGATRGLETYSGLHCREAQSGNDVQVPELTKESYCRGTPLPTDNGWIPFLPLADHGMPNGSIQNAGKRFALPGMVSNQYEHPRFISGLGDSSLQQFL